MILYDSDPSGYSDDPISCFEGDRRYNKDESIFESFEKAKKAAKKRYMQIISEAESKTAELNGIDNKNCPKGENPFR